MSNIPKSINDTLDRVGLRNGPNPQVRQKIIEKEETCLLPPLTLISNPTLAAGQLQIAAKGRKEYQRACVALKKGDSTDAEQHLRKALQHAPKYSAAWVTLGQVLAAQQRSDEARRACLQGSLADNRYIPAYLCLAEIAARAHAWDEVLRVSSRCLELDPANNPLAYEYHAAANLHLHDLAAAEKSGLRAVEIDKDHREPRVYFVLAQIYELKGDSVNEAAQLREYLKYATSPDDIAVVKQYLSKLGTQNGEVTPRIELPPSTSLQTVRSGQPWGPADIDEVVPPVRNTTCPLPQILQETSKRTEDLIENLQRFSATEHIAQIKVGNDGKRHSAAEIEVNYVAQIQENSSGYPTINEYRSGNGESKQGAVVDTGTVTFALIFHPSHLGSFDFRCEGLADVGPSPAWQLRFQEGTDASKSFQSIRIGRSVYLPRLKGRAWIAADTYDVLRMETDLVSPISQIGLHREHLVIRYAPVEFHIRHVRLWLPESASVYLVYRGHRYERIHSFSQFQLFSVDSAQAIKEPAARKDGPAQ